MSHFNGHRVFINCRESAAWGPGPGSESERAPGRASRRGPASGGSPASDLNHEPGLRRSRSLSLGPGRHRPPSRLGRARPGVTAARSLSPVDRDHRPMIRCHYILGHDRPMTVTDSVGSFNPSAFALVAYARQPFLNLRKPNPLLPVVVMACLRETTPTVDIQSWTGTTVYKAL